MITTQKSPNQVFLKNIEEAIKEHGTLACPNSQCHSKLISKKILDRTGNAFLEYNCQNPLCSYHKKRRIEIEYKPTEAKKIDFRFSSDHYLLAFGIVLLSIFSYTGYNLFHVNKYLETELENASKPPLQVEEKLTSNEDSETQEQKTIPNQND